MVSCVIPSYKRADTLKRAIKSVLNQTYNNIEVLIVDDNVPGDEYSIKLKDIVASFDNKCVRYINQETHINGAVARNAGIKNAKGKYIAFLDDDDEWEPEKLQKQVDLLEKHPEIGGCSCLYGLYTKGKLDSEYPPYSSENMQFKILARQVAMYTSTFIGRKEIIEKIGGFCQTLIRHQDLQFFTDFLKYGSIEPINEVLVKLHSDSIINRPNLEKTINVKHAFFDVEKETIAGYPRNQRKRIYAAHYFEVCFAALKEKKMFPAIKWFLKGCNSFSSIKDLYIRFKKR